MTGQKVMESLEVFTLILLCCVEFGNFDIFFAILTIFGNFGPCYFGPSPVFLLFPSCFCEHIQVFASIS